MALNFRNRIEGLTDNLAGNYETLVLYNKEIAYDPLEIRQPINNKTYRSRDDYVPSFWQTIQGNGIVVTNWVSFYSDVNLPDSYQIIHLPVMPVDRLGMIFKDVAVIYRPSSQIYGLLCFARSVSNETLLLEPARIGTSDLTTNEQINSDSSLKLLLNR